MFRKCIITAVFMVLIAPGIANANPSVVDVCNQSATNPTSVRQLIICVAPKLGISTDKALYIAHRESRFHPEADNPTSSACGVFQVVSGTWNNFVHNYLFGHKLGAVYCKNGRMNVVLSLRYVRHHGWGPWGG